jgi:MFS transporter, MHS family, proline/betaine transporter
MAITTFPKTNSLQSKVSQKPKKQIILSCMIGNALEWYDFVIYGYFAATLGALFFPNAQPMTQFLASWGIFWTGFLARPLGSVFFGHIGDKFSRKFALTLSIYVMAIPTTLMGCLPTYEQVGIVAPILLIVLRTFQGFAIGGEFTGSMVFLVEHAPQHKRGFWGSWASFSAVVGVLIGSGVVAVLNNYLSQDSMNNWGWRIPFIISIVGSVVGGYIRRALSDPKVFKEKHKKSPLPLKELFAAHKNKIAQIFFLDFLTAIGFFIIVVFIASYYKKYLLIDAKMALTINTLSMAIFATFILMGGWLSDKIGRKMTMRLPCIGFIVLSYPLFTLMQLANPESLLLAQGILAMMMGLFFGTIPSALVEIMPTSVRFSGLSISHNLCMAILGGGAPLMAAHIIQYTDLLASPAYLLIAASMFSFGSLFFIPEQFKKQLD